MVEFECDKKNFLQALKAVGRAVNAKTPLPILTHILIDAAGERLKMSATDLDMGLTCTCEANISQRGSLALPARLLQEIVSKLPTAPLRISANGDGRASIYCGRAKFEIAALPSEEFPSMLSFEGNSWIQFEQERLRDHLNKVTIATASGEESRAVMTGIRAMLKGGELVLVATDGRRMAHLRATVEAAEDFDVILPGRAAKEIVRQLASSPEPVDLAWAENQLHCRVGDLALHCRLIEGQFPDHKRVMPASFLRHARLGREALLGALNRVLVVAQEKTSPDLVVFDFESDKVTLSSNTPDVGLGTEELPCVLDGEAIKIAFNGRYLVEGLSVLSSEEVVLNLQDDTKSAVLKSYEDESYSYIQMPVRLRELVPA